MQRNVITQKGLANVQFFSAKFGGVSQTQSCEERIQCFYIIIKV